MPTQVPTPVSIRASPRNPINRAPPLKPSIVEEASESSSLSSPSSSPEPNVDIDSLKEGLGAQATANGTSHTKSSTEGSSQTKIVESGGTKRAKASLGTDDSKLIPEVPERVRRFVKRSEKLLGVSSDEESYHSPEESHIDPPLTANIVKSAGSFKKTGHTEKDSKKIEVGSEQRIVEDGEPEEDVGRSSKIKGKRKKKVHVKEESVEIERSEEEAEASKKAKQKRKRKVAVEQEVAEGDEGEEVGESPKKTKRRRKTKEEKEAEAMPIAARTPGLTMFIGAHVSCAKGVHNSVTNCLHIGGNAFAMFLKSQRKWENPPLQDDHKTQFHAHCTEHKYDASAHILPHGSYLVNLAQEDTAKHAQSYDAFLDDLHRCEALGIKLYNFHPGWTGPTATRESALTRIARSLNKVHAVTSTVTPVLEMMAGSGSVIGSTFADMASIIAQVDDKSRVGVCIDTCHVFAAGYDLRTPSSFAGVMNEFDSTVGLKYLKALHLNDSKAPFGSHRDLHANIGTGFLGLRAFHNVMNEKRFEGLPMVLETPIDKKDPDNEKKTIEDKTVWAKEIKMLEGLLGMDTEGEEFKKMEAELSEQGKEERSKHWEQYERKLEKEAKAVEKAKGKGKKLGKEKGQGKQSTLKWQSKKTETSQVVEDNSESELSSLQSEDSN